MSALLSQIESPADLQRLTGPQLQDLTQEIRDELVRIMSIRPAHFASNLGVVELCLALHLTHDFSRDRLIWDTGHQIYPQKLITGRYRQFGTIRTKGGLMGYPNPNESPYDLFMTGHAGCSVSTASGLKAADDLLGETDRKSVAVIGDGAFVSGIVFEAMNNIAGMEQDLLIVLNDNEMSICPRTGGVARYLDKTRMTGLYQESKKTISKVLHNIPYLGDKAHQALEHLRDGMKGAILKEGMLFEEMGFRYFGPVDGHDLDGLRTILADLRTQKGPLLLHVFTNKGEGVPEASADPVKYHTPPVIQKIGPDRSVLELKAGGGRAYTDTMSESIHRAMAADEKVAILTAAMCQGNKLEKVRESYPTRFFDVGICESHAVAFAGGMAKAGMKPIVDIYSTFLQRSFDQIFQEVALQNLPVVFTLDRAGLTGADGPTHHGAFDVPYMRIFPNMICMAPGDETEVEPMLQFALAQKSPTSIRYPKAAPEKIDRPRSPIRLGKAETILEGVDGTFVAFGAMLPACHQAAVKLRAEGLQVGVINARFVKPLDSETILGALKHTRFLITVEEGTLVGGFGSAVLEAANAAGVDSRRIVRLGLPDKFVEHAERSELMADLGLDGDGLIAALRDAAERFADVESAVEVAN